MTPHDKRIEAIDRKAKIGRFSPHHPSQFSKSAALKKKKAFDEHHKMKERRDKGYQGGHPSSFGM